MNTKNLLVAAIVAAATTLSGCQSQESKITEELAHKGQLRCAYVYEIDSVENVVKYKFSIDNNTYHGEFSPKEGASKFTTEDRVNVVYLKRDPKINRRLNW